MKNIALVDDKDYGIIQIKNSIPDSCEYEFYYFSSYKEALNKHFDILFLDYYLDIDGVTGEDVFDQLSADIIIGFSSVSDCNQKLMNKGAQFGVEKLKSEINPELDQIMKKIV